MVSRPKSERFIQGKEISGPACFHASRFYQIGNSTILPTRTYLTYLEPVQKHAPVASLSLFLFSGRSHHACCRCLKYLKGQLPVSHS